jgi:predicted dehydrogenase
MNRTLTRRQFLRTNLALALAAGAFPTILPASALGKNGRPAPNSRLAVGAIGVGPQGRGVLRGFLAQADAQVIAVCDVKQDQLELARQAVNRQYGNTDCQTCGDFRDLLARSDLDAVLIATPDHWHCHVATAAARAGKDMYLEKPMGMSLAEDQILRKAVRKHKRIFQFGTQQRSSSEFQKAVALVRAGRIGKLKQINVWSAASKPGGSTAPIAAPGNMNYDLWLGPARATPYTLGKTADEGAWKTWWFNYDYALGFLAGWGVHPLDIALWAHPAMMRGAMEIEGKAIIPTEGACDTAVAWSVDFTFADGVRLNFRGTPNGIEQRNAMNDMTPFEAKYGKIADHGTAFEGTDGWVLVHRGLLRTHPESLAEEAAALTGVLPIRSPNHVRNFLDGVKSRVPAVCSIEDAVQADLLCHLSDIATRLERKLKFDPLKEKFIKDAGANRKLVLRPMRKPWKLA